MAVFRTYADITTERADVGALRPRGTLLADVLAETGGRYEVLLDLPVRARELIAQAAEVTSDPELAAVAEREHIAVSLDHLRHLDPATTRIRYGCAIEREESDAPWWDGVNDEPG